MLEPHPEAQIEAERQPLLAPDDSNPKDGANQVTPPEKILLRVFAASLSFLVMGIHTAAVGVLIPSMEPYWAITDSQVSLLFVTPLSGYLLASASNSSIHAAFGRRGIAIIGSVCQLLVTIVVALPPSYPIFLLAFAAAGFGIGLIDAGWCAWAGGLRNANTVSGLLHGAYSAGATMGPYLAATLIEGLEWPWWGFYWVMVCLQDDVDRGMLLMTAKTVVAVVEAVVLPWAFWHDTGAKYCAEKAQAHDHDHVPAGPKPQTKRIYRHSVVWICAVYLISYVGAESS